MKAKYKKILKWFTGGIYSEGYSKYSARALLIRLIFNIIVTIIIIRVFSTLADGLFNHKEINSFWNYLKSFIIISAISEFLILWDRLLERLFPDPLKIRLRIAIQSFFALFILVITFSLSKYIFDAREYIPKSIRYLMMLIGYVYAMLFTGNITVTRMVEKLIKSQNELAEIKQEKLRMDYNFLQDQLNPHFLFNNLSVLKSLIIQKKDEPALNFVQNFSDIYRYVLNSADWTTVKLDDEIEFVKKYIDVNKERLDDGLVVEITINKEDLKKEIAPLSIQLLVENAIKHNLVDEENKLIVKIYSEPGYVCIENNVQLIQSTYSTNNGQQNLIKRYKYLTDKEVRIKDSENNYKVSLPLL